MILVVGLAAFGSNLSLKANGPGSSGGGTDPGGGKVMKMIHVNIDIRTNQKSNTASNYMLSGFREGRQVSNRFRKDSILPKKISDGLFKKLNSLFKL